MNEVVVADGVHIAITLQGQDRQFWSGQLHAPGDGAITTVGTVDMTGFEIVPRDGVSASDH